MAKLTLYHASPSRSSIVRWMLEETGEPYDLHLLKLAKASSIKPDYLAVNPMGKVPALKHGDTVDHRGRRHLHLSRRRISACASECSGRRPAPGRLPQMAVLRAELHRACDHRPRLSAG